MNADLDRATRLELVLEGGYANHPKDPGGPTKYGITLYALSQHRGRPCTAADVLALGADEATAIYEGVYAPGVRFADLAVGLDLIVFDAAINCGRGTAGRALQQALNALRYGVAVDGAIGDETLRALAAVNDQAGLIEKVRVQREAFYRGLGTFDVFGAGWLRRLDSVADIATHWAALAAQGHRGQP